MRNAFLLALLGCGGGGGGGGDTPPSHLEPSLADGPGVFTFSPIPLSEISRIVPLGNLAPPDHTIPTDHMYFFMWFGDEGPLPDPDRKYTVVFPGGGRVQSVLPVGEAFKVLVQSTNSFYYYLDHVLPGPGIVVGMTVEAGQVLGTSSGPRAVDFGAIYTPVTLPGFIDPNRYHWQTQHTVSPLAYYEEPLRSALFAKVLRDSADPQGKIDFDQDGRLVGNWFLEGVPAEQSDWPENWNKQIAFVYDVKVPTMVRVSIGGQLAMMGAYAASPTDPDPAMVSQTSGKVVYRLYPRGALTDTPDYSALQGLVIAHVLSDRRIKVEAFQTNQESIPEFTSNAKIYVR